nr:hypothetical protein [uncultured Acinetobacter sp.]
MTEILIIDADKLPKYIWTDLGKEKLCIECKEYFPADTDFFWATGRIKKNGETQIAAACKVCFDKRYKRRKYKIVTPITAIGMVAA